MGIRYWLVDLFHCKNHLCNKKEWSPCERRRCKHIRTNMSESFNAWIRPLNFFLNSLNAHSHKFWVREAGLFYNTHLPAISDLFTRRSNAVFRSTMRRKSRGVLKRPSVQKRPAAMKALVESGRQVVGEAYMLWSEAKRSQHQNSKPAEACKCQVHDSHKAHHASARYMTHTKHTNRHTRTTIPSQP